MHSVPLLLLFSYSKSFNSAVAASSFIGMLCMHWCFSFSSLFFNLLLMGFEELYLYWILSMIFVFSFLSLCYLTCIWLNYAKLSFKKIAVLVSSSGNSSVVGLACCVSFDSMDARNFYL